MAKQFSRTELYALGRAKKKFCISYLIPPGEPAAGLILAGNTMVERVSAPIGYSRIKIFQAS
jgi:hypothetical protein